MFEIIHPDRVTRQSFFRALVTSLLEEPDQTLRQIKARFPEEAHLDRQLETYIALGYVQRSDKRYRASLPWLTEVAEAHLDQQLFVHPRLTDLAGLDALRFETRLTNITNSLVLLETTDIRRQAMTLSNFFAKVARPEEMTAPQAELYALLGDVNPDYALKYLTTFLLKYLRKDLVMQKRPDIFVQALVKLGYIEEREPNKYALLLDMDPEKLTFWLPEK